MPYKEIEGMEYTWEYLEKLYKQIKDKKARMSYCYDWDQLGLMSVQLESMQAEYAMVFGKLTSQE